MQTKIKIIDVSHWQSDIDWKKVKKDGVECAIIKCTQGTSYLDPKFKQNQLEARENGILLGYYHFADGKEPQKEAEWFLKNLGELQEGELVALDWEIENTDPDEWCSEFLTYLEQKLGFKPLLYTNYDRVKRIDWSKTVKGGFGLWIARYGNNDDIPGENELPGTDEWSFFAIWQFSSTGTIDGINGRVDLNYTLMNLDALKKYGSPATETSVEEKDYTENLYKIFEAVKEFFGVDYGENPNDSETEKIINDFKETKSLLLNFEKKNEEIEDENEELLIQNKSYLETIKILNQQVDDLKLENDALLKKYYDLESLHDETVRQSLEANSTPLVTYDKSTEQVQKEIADILSQELEKGLLDKIKNWFNNLFK